jgi:hypothetical protein
MSAVPPEENTIKEVPAKAFEGQYKGYGLGKSGQLVLTNKRLIFVKLGRDKDGRLLLIDKPDYAKTREKLAEGIGKKGSFVIPLHDILEVRADRKLGTPFLLVSHQTSTGMGVHSFYREAKAVPGFGSIATLSYSWPEWADLIASLKPKP